MGVALFPTPSPVETYIQSITELLSVYGITCEASEDFDEFHALCDSIPDKAKPIGLFTACPGESAFWIKGTDPDGKIIHCQAMMLHDLDGQTISSHLETNRDLYCSFGMGLDPDRSVFGRAKCSREAKETTAYHGEMWIDRKWRGNSLALPLSRLGMALAHHRWSPDCIFGFMYSKLIYKGIGAQYGYMHSQPAGALWYRPSQNDFINEWLVYIDREEMRQIISFPIDDEFGSISGAHILEKTSATG